MSFEALNGRDPDLKKYELLKNYIMNYLQPIERRNEARKGKVWEEIESLLGAQRNAFLRHCAIQKNSYYEDKKRGILVCESIQKRFRIAILMSFLTTFKKNPFTMFAS